MISNGNSDNEIIRDVNLRNFIIILNLTTKKIFLINFKLSQIIKFKKLVAPKINNSDNDLNENEPEFERETYPFKKNRYNENKLYRKNFNNLREGISDLDDEKTDSYRKNRYNDDDENDFENNQNSTRPYRKYSYNRENSSYSYNKHNNKRYNNKYTSSNEDF